MVERLPLYYYRRQPGRARRDFRSDALDATRVDRSRLAISAVRIQGRIQGEPTNVCMLRDTVCGGRRTGHDGDSVWCVAERKRAGRDAGSLEPRGGRAGQSGVPRTRG